MINYINAEFGHHSKQRCPPRPMKRWDDSAV